MTSPRTEASSAHPSPPWGWKWRSHTVFILITVGMGMFTDLFLYALIVPVLPFMLQERLQIPEAEIQPRVDEMLAIYAGGSVFFSPFAGFMADHISSRRIPFLLGLAALFSATMLLAVGDSLPVLYTARLLQGLSAGVVWPVGLALTMDTVGAERLGTAIGSMFTFVTAGPLVAPTIGGSLYANFGYFGVVSVGGVILVVDFILRLIMIEKRFATQYVDATQPATGSVHENERGQTERDHERGDGNARANEETPLLKSPDSSAFVISPNQSLLVKRFPFLYCLGDYNLLSCLAITFVQGIMYGSFDATVPIFTKELFGFGSFEAGLMFICIGATDMISGPIVGHMVDRYGTKLIATLSYVCLAMGLASLRFVTDNMTHQLVLYCALLAFCGVGLGLISTPALVEAAIVVKRYYEPNADFFGRRPPYAQLYGLCSTTYMAGLTGGPLFAGWMKIAVGYGNMTTILAGLCIATSLVAWGFLGG